jgi:hypothetical protein
MEVEEVLLNRLAGAAAQVEQGVRVAVIAAGAQQEGVTGAIRQGVGGQALAPEALQGAGRLEAADREALRPVEG